MIILQSPEEYSRIIQSHPILFVQFGSHTCAPCGAIQDRIEFWRTRHIRSQFLYIPAEQFQQLCSQMGVYSVPTVWVYVDGKLTIQNSGIFSIDDILNKTNRYYKMFFENT